mgnify:CR=1 FL=1
MAAVIAGAIGYVPYRLYGKGGVGHVLRLQRDLEGLTAANLRLAEENGRLRRRIQQLREEPAAVERVARDELGLVRPNDLVFLFE